VLKSVVEWQKHVSKSVVKWQNHVLKSVVKWQKHVSKSVVKCQNHVSKSVVKWQKHVSKSVVKGSLSHPSIVFTPLSLPPFPGDRNPSREGLTNLLELLAAKSLVIKKIMCRKV